MPKYRGFIKMRKGKLTVYDHEKSQETVYSKMPAGGKAAVKAEKFPDLGPDDFLDEQDEP